MPVALFVAVPGIVNIEIFGTIIRWDYFFSALLYLLKYKICSDDRVCITHEITEQTVGPRITTISCSTWNFEEHLLDPVEIQDHSSKTISSVRVSHLNDLIPLRFVVRKQLSGGT